MKSALLCNGPSRVAFNPDLGYNYVIGCNIPWTKVDSTVVMDVNVLDKLESVRFYASRKSWLECPNSRKDKLIGYLAGLYDSIADYDSAGHAAARILLKEGATQIDIYGCDSWFTNNTESFTHKYIDSRAEDMTKHVSVWRQRWYELIGKNPDVKFNFIGESK